ncbi:MAG: DUF5684 domain-containing protein [Mycoplasmatota bacterium]|nr:DUF5684 domain-containing protein [Mycoplasmatota bacterium]
MSTYGYDSYYNMSSMAETIVGGLLIFFLIIILISLAIAICTIVGQWRAFKKAGKGGWEAIIPIYNQIVLCQIVGVNPWWILIVAVGGMVLSLIPVLGPLCSLALSIYFAVLLNVSAARSFGKSDGFAAGLIFLAPIFWLILGSNKTQYVGVTPMNDVVLNFVNDKFGNSANNTTNNMNNNSNQNMNNSTQATNIKFCTSCGYKMSNNERFCPSCGKESK